jgi:hypothetical protein
MINMSLIPKGSGLDSKGKLIFDDVEGMPFEEAMRLRKRFTNTAGTIVIGISDAHIKAALADPRIDYVIPYHRSGLSSAKMEKYGMESGWKDYTLYQNPKVVDIKKNEALGGKYNSKGKFEPVHPKWSEYEGDPKKYFKSVAKYGLEPIFPQFKNDPNYHKFIIDRKLFNNKGEKIEQQILKPEFDMDTIKTLLKDYKAPRETANAKVVDRVSSEVKGGKLLLQQEPNNPAVKGAYSEATKNIFLSLKARDASTFMHEASHGFLQAMGDYVKQGIADEGLQKDYATIRKWLGAKEGIDLTREQKEKFAESFEAYLREGKAPTYELQSVFSKFKQWLIKIYKTISSIGTGQAEVSSEVRDVMDRMVASEEEIAKSRTEMGFDKDLGITGLSEEVTAKLGDLKTKAHEEAVKELLKIQMKELSPENQRVMERKREEFYQQEFDALKQSPEYGTASKMEHYFEGQAVKDVAQKYLDGKLTDDEKVTFDALAEVGKYYSGEEMAKKLVELKPLEVAAAEQADALMHANYPDFRNTDEIQKEAQELVHNKYQLEVMALEREILQSKVAKTELGAQASRMRRTQTWMAAEIAEKKADEILSSVKIGEVKSPVSYFTAERNAAVQVAKAVSKKDYALAADWKQKQMTNHALAMGMMKLRKRVAKDMRQIGTMAFKKRELFKDDKTFNQVANLLSRYGFRDRPDYDPAQRTESLTSYVNRMDAFFKIDAGDGTPYSIPDWILENDAPRSYKDMTIAELDDVNGAMKNIVHVENMQDKFYAMSDKVTIEQMAQTLATEADKNLGAKISPKQLEKKTSDLEKMAQNGLYSHLQILTILQKLDGGDPDGIWNKSLLRLVQDRAEQESKSIDATSKKLTDVMSVYTEKEKNDMRDVKLIVPEFGLDRENPITKETLMSILLNMGNDGNRDRLLSKEPEGFKPTFEWSRANAEEAFVKIKEVLGRYLDARDFKVAQGIWDTIGSHWPQIAELHKRMTGFEPVNVKAVPFDIIGKDGKTTTLSGGYYPLKEDARSGPRGFEKEAVAETELSKQSNTFRVAVTRHGFTEKRTGGTYSVALSLDVIKSHLGDVIHDIHFRDVVMDIRRLMSNKTFFEGVKRNIGLSGYRFLKEWLLTTAAGPMGDTALVAQSDNFYNTVVRWMNKNAVSSAIMFAPRIVSPNLSNLFLYGRAIKGWTYADSYNAFLKYGLFNYLPKVLARVGTIGSHKAALDMRQFIWSKSQFMKDRANNPEPSIKEYKKVFMGKSRDLQSFGSSLLSWSDDWMNVPQWLGAYMRSLDNGKSESEAVHFADSLIKSAIMPESIYERAPIFRSKSETVRMFTQLYSFFNAQLNRFIREELPGLKHPIKNAPRLLGFAASQMLFIVSSAIFAAQGPKKDASPEENTKWLISQILRNYMAYVPVFREAGGYLVGRALGTGFGGYRPSMGFGAVGKSLASFYKIVNDVYTGDATFQSIAEPVTQISSFVGRYPNFINSLLWNAYDWFENGMDVQVGDFFGRRPRSER